MTVPLFPPTTSAPMRIDAVPLLEGPRFVRTGGMSRWHRVRSGQRDPGGRIMYALWCNGFVVSGGFVALEELPAAEPVCGPCEGRAIGSGQEANPDGRRLMFTPRGLTPPRHCPGSRNDRLYTALPGGTTGKCLACRDTHPVRAMGGPFNPRTALVQHPPGAGLVPPCPFHRWKYLAPAAGRAVCGYCHIGA